MLNSIQSDAVNNVNVQIFSRFVQQMFKGENYSKEAFLIINKNTRLNISVTCKVSVEQKQQLVKV